VPPLAQLVEAEADRLAHVAQPLEVRGAVAVRPALDGSLDGDIGRVGRV
jgi:hypothetical protein